MNPIKLGVIGVSGHYGLRLQIPLRNSPLIKLTALGSRNYDKAREMAQQWGFDKAYGSYQEVLDDPDVEVVYIPLPNHVHHQWIRNCIDAGKAVICEKPLTLNAEEAADIMKYAESKGVPVMEGFMYRFHPQWVRAKELVRCGEIGQIRSIHAIFCYNNTDPNNIRNIKEAGGGAILDIGCYVVSSSRFLLDAEPKRILAQVDFDTATGTDSFTSAILDFGSARTQLTISTRLSSHQKITVFGTKGYLTMPIPFNAFPDVPAILTVNNGVCPREIQCGPADQYRLMFEAFTRAIREGQPGPTPLSDAVANLKVLDSIFRSGKSNCWEFV